MDDLMVAKLMFLAIGLLLGYVAGVARTTMKYINEIRAELHECHEKLYEEGDQGDKTTEG